MQSAPSISFLPTSKKHCNYIAGYVPETFEIYGKTGHTLHTNLSRKRGYAKTLLKPVEICVLVCTENIFKRDFQIPQTQIHKMSGDC